jgi:hypothetical protein
VPGVYFVGYNNLTGEYKLRRLRCTAFTEYGDSLTDISDVVAKDGNVWALGTGTRANKLYKLNENNVSDILTTISLDPLGLPTYQTRKLSLTDDGLFLTARAFVPSYISFSSGSSGVYSSVGPPTYPAGSAVDSQEIDVRVHCQKDDWSTSGWLVSRKSGGGSSINTADPYWIRNENGEMRFVVRAGGTSIEAAELTSNLGCVNGQYRWLRFTYNNRSYAGDNPSAQWRMRFWHSDDGVSWTMQSYVQHSPGGALSAGGSSFIAIGYVPSLFGTGWNGDIASVLIYNESDTLIHDLSLSSVDTWSATSIWQASSTLGWWRTESGLRVQGAVYVTQRRDPSTGAVLWTQVGNKEVGIHTPLSVKSDGSHAYVLSTGARSDEDGIVVAPAIVKVNLSDGSEVARYTHESGEARDFTLMNGNLYMTVIFNVLVKVSASSMALVAFGTVGNECTVLDNDDTHLFVSCPGPFFQNFAKVDSSLVTLLLVFVGSFGGVTQIVIPKNASGNFVERMYNAQSTGLSSLYKRSRSDLSTSGSNNAVYPNESPRALAVIYKASEWGVNVVNW